VTGKDISQKKMIEKYRDLLIAGEREHLQLPIKAGESGAAECQGDGTG